jgi:predicted metalloendopeptidase
MYNKFTLKELTRKSPFLNWTKYFDDAFDYHSKTTISFSSEIRPRLNRHESIDQLKNQTSYSITSTNGGAPLPAATINLDSATGGVSRSSTSNSNDEQQSRSTISKHKITDDEDIVIYSPEYFADLSSLIQQYTETDRGRVTLANYMAWSVIQSLIATLPKNFRDASKVLRKALIGSEGIEVSWRYCVTDTNQVMGFALGSLFVRQVFQGRSKERAEEMIFAIRNAFKDNLSNLAWMDDSTRTLAREKADHINQMIGFPDFILNPEKLNGKYEGVSVTR